MLSGHHHILYASRCTCTSCVHSCLCFVHFTVCVRSEWLSVGKQETAIIKLFLFFLVDSHVVSVLFSLLSLNKVFNFCFLSFRLSPPFFHPSPPPSLPPPSSLPSSLLSPLLPLLPLPSSLPPPLSPPPSSLPSSPSSLFPPPSPLFPPLSPTPLPPLPPSLPPPSVMTGCETANKYRIRNTLGQQVYFAAERKKTTLISQNSQIPELTLYSMHVYTHVHVYVYMHLYMCEQCCWNPV